MLLTGDYHTHTPYSHGKNTVAENVAAAKMLGLKEIAITDHGFAHKAFGVKRKEIAACRKECEEAEKEYGVKVLLGMEANIRGYSGVTDMTEADYENFDIFNCGFHVFISCKPYSHRYGYFWGNLLARKLFHHASKSLIRRNTKAYIEAIKNNPIDTLTHLSYVCPADVLEVAKCAADYGTYIELNSKKMHLTDEQLTEIAQKTSARFIINSDAHSCDRVGDTKIVDEQLTRIAFPIDRIDNIDGRLPDFRFAAYKKHL
ncbi:MAG: PHP domain-containing protein [Clostridia bacterium]|nr:PHP domain-containing protein [Clostridia bacterium]